MSNICTIDSPIGRLTAASDGTNLTGLWLEGQKYYGATLENPIVRQDLPVFALLKQWLDVYFAGGQPDVVLPLAPSGSEFRQAVWGALIEIPYGTIVTYGDIAKQLRQSGMAPKASARAVGGAVGHNPIAILIPCHRVMGASGSLTGYAGGVEAKAHLLQLEKALVD